MPRGMRGAALLEKIDGKAASGEWMIEGGTPNTLMRRGVSRDTVKIGTPVVVTGYTAQKRESITGAASSANTESMAKQTTATALQALDGRVPGVTVESDGAPGSRTIG